jgi:exosortase family protein XrtM
VSTATPVGFGIRFLVLFGLLFAGFEALRGSAAERVLVEDAVLAPAVVAINTLAPAEHVERRGRTLQTTSSALTIVRGCEGVEMLLLLFAAIVAFPTSWRQRARGLAAGIALAYALSLARIVALHFSLRYMPGAWELLHGVLLPLGPIAVLALYFLHWTATAITPVAGAGASRAH